MKQPRTCDLFTFLSPQGRKTGSMGKRSLSKIACVIFLCSATAIASPAKTHFKKLANFDLADGATPYATLIQATDGNFYGTTPSGGANLTNCGSRGCGTIFKVTARGKLITLYSFCAQQDCADGSLPYGSLIQATDGSFYGTTAEGGENLTACNGNGCGTIFRITPAGQLTTLYSFCSQQNCADGEGPLSGLVQTTNGTFYGTTAGGGANSGGTVFNISAAGTLTTLYSFCALENCTDGTSPQAGLVQATDGNFYGTTYQGGTYRSCPGQQGCGTVFTVTPGGALTTLHSFNGTDGWDPVAGLVQATDGNFYGTTYEGGANCTFCGGTVFEITPEGTLTTLYDFCPKTQCGSGSNPLGVLVQATDGNFYGTTISGGMYGTGGNGTVFKINTGGNLITLHSFAAPRSYYPYAGLVQATNGDFYGTTAYGGLTRTCNFQKHFRGCGTVFRLAVGLEPASRTKP